MVVTMWLEKNPHGSRFYRDNFIYIQLTIGIYYEHSQLKIVEIIFEHKSMRVVNFTRNKVFGVIKMYKLLNTSCGFN